MNSSQCVCMSPEETRLAEAFCDFETFFPINLRHCDCWKNLHSLFIYFLLSKEFRHWLAYTPQTQIVKWQTTLRQNTFLPFNKSRSLRNELFWNGLSFACFNQQNLRSYAVSKIWSIERIFRDIFGLFFNAMKTKRFFIKYRNLSVCVCI